MRSRVLGFVGFVLALGCGGGSSSSGSDCPSMHPEVCTVLGMRPQCTYFCTGGFDSCWEDGGVVVRQLALDPVNCGGCGIRCAAGQRCDNNHCHN